jgi:hypothetical protein
MLRQAWGGLRSKVPRATSYWDRGRLARGPSDSLDRLLPAPSEMLPELPLDTPTTVVVGSTSFVVRGEDG